MLLTGAPLHSTLITQGSLAWEDAVNARRKSYTANTSEASRVLASVSSVCALVSVETLESLRRKLDGCMIRARSNDVRRD